MRKREQRAKNKDKISEKGYKIANKDKCKVRTKVRTKLKPIYFISVLIIHKFIKLLTKK